MERLHMWNVGDGLSMLLWSRSRRWLHIDCGSLSDAETAERTLGDFPFQRYTPGDFLLSHFHADHYNGVLLAASKAHHSRDRLSVTRLYYPRVPSFTRSGDFMVALFAMNMRVFGAESGVMEYDFVKAIRRLSQSPFSVTPLSAGDIFMLDGAPCSVLWPPRKVENKVFSRRVEKALAAFDEAVDSDKHLHEIARRVREENAANPFWGGEEIELGPLEDVVRHSEAMKALPEPSDVVNAANGQLRNVANELSLAFHEGGRFLFLGDLKSKELKKVVGKLLKSHYESFEVVIAPHHGTHWHEDLEKLRPLYVMSSFGKRRAPDWKPDFEKMGGRSLGTLINGDLRLSLRPWWIENESHWLHWC